MSTVRGGELPGLNHRFEVVSGVREEECRELMQAFFESAQRRVKLIGGTWWPARFQARGPSRYNERSASR